VGVAPALAVDFLAVAFGALARVAGVLAGVLAGVWAGAPYCWSSATFWSVEASLPPLLDSAFWAAGVSFAACPEARATGTEPEADGTCSTYWSMLDAEGDGGWPFAAVALGASATASSNATAVAGCFMPMFIVAALP
jgi:hypothetical protein